jgi:hypothetical protein
VNTYHSMLISGLLVVVTATAIAAQSASRVVTMQTTAINVVAVTGGTQTMIINTAVPGSPPTSVINGVTWAVTTNQSTAWITASIPSAMPAGVTLSVTLQAPPGGTSAGIKALGTVAVTVVSGVTKVAASLLTLTYTLAATAAAGVVTAQSRLVTYTITGGV